MNTDQINEHARATQRLTDLIGVLKYQRINFPNELTWFQRALIHLEHSAWIEYKNNLTIGIQREPRYILHKSLQKKV